MYWKRFGKARISRFIAAESATTHARSWWWRLLPSSLRLRVSGVSSTNTLLQRISILHGQPSR